MSQKVYECKKGFSVDKWDNDNDCFSDEFMTIEEGSVWSRCGYNYRVIDGEIRLENDDTGDWLEIDKDTLEEHFKDITDSNSEMKDEYLRSGY